MVNIPAIILGTIIYTVLVLTGAASGMGGMMVGIIVSGSIIGYIVGKNMFRGIIHGGITGITGSLFLLLIQWSNISLICCILSNEIDSFKLILSSIILTGIGGLIGTIIRRVVEN